MAIITVNPGNLRKHQPAGEHITRIMYDDNEPPKNYIWGKPDGFLYIWDGVEWIKLNEVPNTPPHDFPPEPRPINPDDYMSKSEFDLRLKQLKNEIIGYLVKLINARACSDEGQAAIDWISENVIPRISRLEEIDHDAFATDEALQDAVRNLEESDSNINSVLNNYMDSTNNTISNINTTVSELASYDHSKFVTAEDVTDIANLL